MAVVCANKLTEDYIPNSLQIISYFTKINLTLLNFLELEFMEAIDYKLYITSAKYSEYK